MKVEYEHPASHETHATCWINNRVGATVSRPGFYQSHWRVATPDGVTRLETNMRPSRAAIVRIAQNWLAVN